MSALGDEARAWRVDVDAGNARVMKRDVQATGDRITIFLGPDAEIDYTGTWTKYVGDDIKRRGNGAGAQPYWQHRDHLKSIKVTTDAAGAEVGRIVYRPFGEIAVQTGTDVDAKGYIGERKDAETGLLYLNARYYDPVLARFISPDWWDPNKQGVKTNRYSFALSDPLAGFLGKFPLSVSHRQQRGHMKTVDKRLEACLIAEMSHFKDILMTAIATERANSLPIDFTLLVRNSFVFQIIPDQGFLTAYIVQFDGQLMKIEIDLVGTDRKATIAPIEKSHANLLQRGSIGRRLAFARRLVKEKYSQGK